jgi:hypothetical protein
MDGHSNARRPLSKMHVFVMCMHAIEYQRSELDRGGSRTVDHRIAGQPIADIP